MQPPPCFKLGSRPNLCAKQLHAERVEGRIDLPQEHWFKWKIRGQYLIGPGGMRFTSRTLAATWRAYVQNVAHGSERPSSLPEQSQVTEPSDISVSSGCATTKRPHSLPLRPQGLLSRRQQLQSEI